MPNPICPIHGTEAIIKPAGTGKTGRKYNSFYTCTEKSEDGGFCPHKFTERPPIGGLFGAASAKAAAATGDKDKAIKYMNALKIASELISAGIVKAPSLESAISWKEVLQATAEYVYRLSPPSDIPKAPLEDEPPF